MGLNWLITGGCGFIGTSLIARLIEDNNNRIRVIDNLTVGGRDDLASVCNFVEINGHDSGFGESARDVQLRVGDILDFDAVDTASVDADVIVHLAANTGVAPSVEDPRMDCMSNVVGTFNVLEAARKNGVGRFIFASSGAPVGEVTPPIHEEMAPHPVSPYGASKLAGEAYCSAYFRTFGIDTVCLRFGNVYGPRSGHKSSVVAKFIREAVAGEVLEIYGDGRQTRDFIYIDDLADAICASAVKENIGGEAFQIATQSETTLNELSDVLVRVIVEEGLVKQAPEVLHGDFRLGDVMRNYSDTSKAREMLGWTAETTLEEGLRKTMRWFASSQ